MTAARPVFYVSDGTGITAETIGHSILTQFTCTRFATDRIPFVDSPEKARDVAARIRGAGEAAGLRPIIVSSCVDAELTQALAESGALVLDVFAPFIAPMEQELGLQRMPQVGQAHGIVDFDAYHRRINAMNYALTHDDGMRLDYAEADLILVGVSRAGKTPTCVYLALHYGIRAANYPLTEEDLESDRLPPRLRPYRNKLFGLTIQPERLSEIRNERRPNSRYASLANCRMEVSEAEAMMRRSGIRWLSTTTKSIEEIATTILQEIQPERLMY